MYVCVGVVAKTCCSLAEMQNSTGSMRLRNWESEICIGARDSISSVLVNGAVK